MGASLIACSFFYEVIAMIKNKKRYCDKCGKELQLIDFTQPDINPHDILCLGFKTKTGRTINKTYDLCSTCMDQIDAVLGK